MKTNKRQTQYLTVPNTMLNDQDITMKCDASSGSLTSSISYQISSQHTNESSQSPQNPQHSMMECDDEKNQQLYDQSATMLDNGFTPIHEVAKTLQGCIWRVYYKELECYAIIKVTNKILSQQHIGIDHRQGRYFECNENIKQEINMLYSLNSVNENESIHPAMIGLYKVFEDRFNIFIAMEDGGSDLLSLINKCHQQLKNHKMLLSDWKITAKQMMKQMTEFLRWLHDDKHACHLDISLENLSIQNVEWEYNVKSKTFKLLPNFQIKFIDFGVAERFNEKIQPKPVDDESDDDGSYVMEDEEEEIEYYENEDEISFECTKFVGKLKYFAPNILNHLTFDARAADIWSLGIVLFMVCTGYCPWNKPSDDDIYYNLIVIQQRLTDVLKHWNRECYIDDDVHQLFYRIFSDQMYRADANEILQHSWLKM